MANSRAKWFVGTVLTLCTIGLVVGLRAQSLPGPPSGLIASITGTTVTLQWQPPAGGSPSLGYVVEAGSAPGASDIGRFPTNPSPTALIATNVGAGTYFVRVRASNGSGAECALQRSGGADGRGLHGGPQRTGIPGRIGQRLRGATGVGSVGGAGLLVHPRGRIGAGRYRHGQLRPRDHHQLLRIERPGRHLSRAREGAKCLRRQRSFD